MKTILSLTRLYLYFAVVITSLLILNVPSFAVTFTVKNLNDSGPGSFRQAILDANANNNGPAVKDTIVFAQGLSGAIPTDGDPGNNTFSLWITISDDLTISGPGTEVIAIDAQMKDKRFFVNKVGYNIVVAINGLKFINFRGEDGGVIS